MNRNKKIANATRITYDNIQFKSKLEAMCYKTLKEHGIKAEYEKETFVLSPKLKPKIPFYTRGVKTPFHLHMRVIPELTYTPDFTFNYNNRHVIIEMKGFSNDTYPVKRNLFRKLINNKPGVVFFEIRSKSELLKAIKIIKQDTNESI